MRAVDIITDAYERMNRLSPGEALSADDAAFGLRRLNLLVDELSACAPFLFQTVTVSAAQTGHITFGAGAWASIAPGAVIQCCSVDGLEIAPLTMAQYFGITIPSTGGAPTFFAPDGLSTVYLYPVPAGQTLALLTRVGVSAFADQTTVYTAPPGYLAYLGAALAVRCAPSVIGKLPPELKAAETACKFGVASIVPAIVDYGQQGTRGDIFSGW